MVKPVREKKVFGFFQHPLSNLKGGLQFKLYFISGDINSKTNTWPISKTKW